MKKTLRLTLIIAAVLFCSCNSVGNKATQTQQTSVDTSTMIPTDTSTMTQSSPPYDTQAIKKAEQYMTNQTTTSDDDIHDKLKAQAEQDWPNDYTTQEYWINREMDDYQYMKAIPDDK